MAVHCAHEVIRREKSGRDVCLSTRVADGDLEGCEMKCGSFNRSKLAIFLGSIALVGISSTNPVVTRVQAQTVQSGLTSLICRKDAKHGSIVLPDRFTVSFSDSPPVVQINGQNFAHGSFSVTGTQISAKVVSRVAVGAFWIQIRRSDGAYRVVREGTTMVEDVGWCSVIPRSF